MPPPDANDPPDLGDWGASVTVDSGGNVRQVTATVAGHGPFVHEPGSGDAAPGGAGAPRTTAAGDARLRHDIDLLQQAIAHLQGQHDAAGIAHAVVTVCTVANAAVHHDSWVESEGLAEETRHWTAVAGTEGSLETFEAARTSVVSAAEHLVGVLEALFADHDLVGRAIQQGVRGGEALTYLAQTAAYARGRLSFTTPAALQLLDEAIRELQSATTGEIVLRDTLTVLSMTNNAMWGADHWEQALADEYREWVSLTERSGTAEEFTHARDQIVTAATDARRDLGAWEHRRIDPGAAAGIAHGLVLVTQQARGGLHAP